MKLSVEVISHNRDEEIMIKCYDPQADWVRYVKCVQNDQYELLGNRDGKIHRLNLKDVYYFEVVDNKSFIYCKNAVYESKLKLYEFEEKSKGTVFFRASKSMVLNADTIECILPSISGRFEAVLLNGEKVTVSRKYVSVLKKMIGM